MKKILCFGDSNTWGIAPTGKRYKRCQRWTGILAELLLKVSPQAYAVIEAGQPNRTLVNNAPFSGKKSGVSYLKPYLLEHQPQLVLIMLGTNDVKKRFDLKATDIALALKKLTIQALALSLDSDIATKAKVMIIAPPPIFEVGSYSRIYQGGAEKSAQLAEHYAQLANQLGCYFFDAGSVIKSCEKDGVHWQVDQHLLLAQALVERVQAILPVES